MRCRNMAGFREEFPQTLPQRSGPASKPQAFPPHSPPGTVGQWRVVNRGVRLCRARSCCVDLGCGFEVGRTRDPRDLGTRDLLRALLGPLVFQSSGDGGLEEVVLLAGREIGMKYFRDSTAGPCRCWHRSTHSRAQSRSPPAARGRACAGRFGAQLRSPRAARLSHDSEGKRKLNCKRLEHGSAAVGRFRHPDRHVGVIGVLEQRLRALGVKCFKCARSDTQAGYR